MRVADIFTPRPVSLQLQASTDEALRVMSLHGYREYPVVVAGDRVVGFVSDEELLTHAVARRPLGTNGVHARRSRAGGLGGANGRARGLNGAAHAAPHPSVREVMRRPPVPIGMDEPCSLAAWRMVETGAHALCVTEDTVLRGIVTSTNLLRAYTWFVRESGHTADEPAVGGFTKPVDAFPAPEDPAAEAWALLRSLDVRGLPVVSASRVVGSVSGRRLLELTRTEASGRGATVRDAQGKALATISVAASLVEAAEGLLKSKQSALPVADLAGRLVGIVTRRAVVKHCATANLTYGSFPS